MRAPFLRPGRLRLRSLSRSSAIAAIGFVALAGVALASTSCKSSSEDDVFEGDEAGGDDATTTPPIPLTDSGIPTDGTIPLGAGDSGRAGDDAGEDANGLGDDDDDASIIDAAHDSALPPSDAMPEKLLHPYALTGFVGTGQSLSVGYAGTPVISTTQPYHNVRLEDSTSDPTYTDSAQLTPLVAPFHALNNGSQAITYPTNVYGETPSESTANQISATSFGLDHDDYPSATSVVGESGQALTVIQKNGTGNSYAQALREAHAIVQLANAVGHSFGYGAVFLTHGETDSQNASYEAGLVQLQSDYDTDLRAATGQFNSGVIPLFLTQQGTFPNSHTTTSLSTEAAWRAAVDNPGKIVCVGPKYQYEYASDGVHLPASAYVQLGEKYGEAYITQVATMGGSWRPLQPLTATHTGTDLVVHMDVAFAPLNWDTALEANHATVHAAWQHGYGFEVSDSTGELTISSVAINGSDVHITLASAPTGTGLTVAYAMSQDIDAYGGGLVGGRHGALRDSDPFTGRDAETIAVTVTQGSPTVTAVTAGTFAARALHDRVSGGGVALTDNVNVVARSGNNVTLSSNWAGASGTVMMSFAHEQRNYLVQFSMAAQ